MGRSPVQPSKGKFGGRNTAGSGGNRQAGPFEEFPLGYGPWAMRNFFVSWNDFERLGDLETTTDWTGADVGVAAATANTIIVDPSAVSAAYGVLRVDAGTTDATGRALSRAFSGSNAANLVRLALTSTGDPANSSSGTRLGHRRVAFGARIRLTETGTATQSAFVFGLGRDEETNISTAGALTGATANFGFVKAVGSNSVAMYSRTSSTFNSITTAGQSALYTMVPGTSTVTGTWVELSMVVELRSTTNLHMDGFVNGVYIQSADTTTAAQTPAADAFAPKFAVVNGTGADCTFDVDYYWMMGERF